MQWKRRNGNVKSVDSWLQLSGPVMVGLMITLTASRGEAQQAPAAAPGGEELETIVVTAQKRDQNLTGTRILSAWSK
jgi:hypothetical protein